MAERIMQQREAPVGLLTRRCLENGTRSERSSNGGVEVSDDEVQVQGRPVSSVAAKLFGPFEGLAPGCFEQQVEWGFCP